MWPSRMPLQDWNAVGSKPCAAQSCQSLPACPSLKHELWAPCKALHSMLYGSSSNACLFIACIIVRQVRMAPRSMLQCCRGEAGSWNGGQYFKSLV